MKALTLSLESQTLRYRLLVAFALIFVLPAVIFLELPSGLTVISQQRIALHVAAALATAGLGFALMRIAVDRISILASSLRENAVIAATGPAAAVPEPHLIEELREIARSFNELLLRFHEKDAELGRRIAEIEALKEVALIGRYRGGHRRPVQARL